MEWKDHGTEPLEDFAFVKQINSILEFANYVVNMKPSPFEDIIRQREETIFSGLTDFEREKAEEMFLEELLKETDKNCEEED